MKRMLLAVAAFALIGFASCKKEDFKACYTCKTVSSYVANGMPVSLPPIPGLPGSLDTTYCDKTQGDIETIQKDGSSTQNFTFGGYTIVSTQRTDCIKQ